MYLTTDIFINSRNKINVLEDEPTKCVIQFQAWSLGEILNMFAERKHREWREFQRILTEFRPTSVRHDFPENNINS